MGIYYVSHPKMTWLVESEENKMMSLMTWYLSAFYIVLIIFVPFTAGLGCYNSFPSDRLGNFTDEIQWSGLFSSQMQKLVKKCAQLAAKKRKRFFALEDFGNCHGARAFSSGSGSKGTRCIFGVGVKSHFFVYEISS